MKVKTYANHSSKEVGYLSSPGEHEVSIYPGIEILLNESVFTYIMRIEQNPFPKFEGNKKIEKVFHTMFVPALATVLAGSFPAENTQFQTFEEIELQCALKQTLCKSNITPENSVLISLDPLLLNLDGYETHRLGISRNYLPYGEVDCGITNSPGYPPIAEQIERLSVQCSGKQSKSLVLVEDDIFSGGTITLILELLRKNGITIDHIVPGIQIGTPRTEELITKMIPVVQYNNTDLGQCDLGDPRDFLLGASGLVILYNGNKYRVPYFWPFVSTEARASVKAGTDKPLGEQLLALSMRFYKDLEAEGVQLCLKDADPAFAKLVEAISGVLELDCSPGTPMSTITEYVVRNADKILNLWGK